VAPGTKRAAVSSVSMRVTGSQIAAAQTMLDRVFPAELREIYLASDDVFDRPGQWFVIWPLAEVVTGNHQAWSQDASQTGRDLVGFGDDGTGAPFCATRNGDSKVVALSPIEDAATLLAESIADFWTKREAGTLPPH
jgi:hypothetical protein